MTTRSARSRKKHKSAASAASSVGPGLSASPGHDEQIDTLSLPLEAVTGEDQLEASSLQAMAQQVEGGSDLPHIEPPSADTIVEAVATPAAAATESILLPVGERSRMRVEVSEDRTGLGSRLRAARESRAWSREDVAHRLHVPTTVIADVEAERFERLGAPIYVRGYLSKYAALVGLPSVVVNRAIEGMSEPVLKASTEAPRSLATWERYRVAVIGAVITMAVAVPVLTLVANRGINAPVPQVRSLDESEMSEPMAIQPSVTLEHEMPPAGQASEPVLLAPQSSPLASSAAPEVPLEPVAPADPEAAPAATSSAMLASMSGFSTPPAAEGLHVVEARFREDSWIEIFDESGRVVEQALVRAGQSRRYESTGALSVKIGNVGGVDLQADGNAIDLAAHARANVARLRLFEAATTPTP